MYCVLSLIVEYLPNRVQCASPCFIFELFQGHVFHVKTLQGVTCGNCDGGHHATVFQVTGV